MDGIARNINGIYFSICIEHLPNRKKPLLVATVNGMRYKVAEITDEDTLRIVCSNLFLKVVE